MQLSLVRPHLTLSLSSSRKAFAGGPAYPPPPPQPEKLIPGLPEAIGRVRAAYSTTKKKFLSPQPVAELLPPWRPPSLWIF